MKRRLARATLALYPLAFRRRYGDEMLALVEDSPPSSRATFDLLWGAAIAHVRPSVGISAALSPEDRLRGTSSGVLACWIAFAAGGLGFYKTTEDHPFSKAGDAHLAVGGAHTAIQILAVIASIAVIAGALPLVVPALRQARRSGRCAGRRGWRAGPWRCSRSRRWGWWCSRTRRDLYRAPRPGSPSPPGSWSASSAAGSVRWQPGAGSSLPGSAAGAWSRRWPAARWSPRRWS